MIYYAVRLLTVMNDTVYIHRQSLNGYLLFSEIYSVTILIEIVGE